MAEHWLVPPGFLTGVRLQGVVVGVSLAEDDLVLVAEQPELVAIGLGRLALNDRLRQCRFGYQASI